VSQKCAPALSQLISSWNFKVYELTLATTQVSWWECDYQYVWNLQSQE